MTDGKKEQTKVLTCLYIAVESEVADDVKTKVLAREKELVDLLVSIDSLLDNLVLLSGNSRVALECEHLKIRINRVV